MNKDSIENRFSYHPPKDKETIEAHITIRARAKELALQFDGILPEGREKSLALTRLEEALMWANAAIARESKE